MKKIISVMLFTLLLLTSCSVTNTQNVDSSSASQNDDSINNKHVEYSTMILSGVESGVFEDSFIIPEAESREEIVEDTTKSTICLGIQETEAYKTKIIYTDRTITDEYKSENGSYIYQIDRNSNSFSIRTENGAVLQEYSSADLTEEKLLRQIKEFIKFYLPNESLENYTESCKTRIIVQNADSAWGESKDSFYQADEEMNEVVSYYEYVFRLFHQSLKTPDSIIVRCDGDGNITSIMYNNYGIDWNSVSIELDTIREKARDFISNVILDEYSMENCSFMSESLDYFDSKIRVIVECELTLSRKGYDNIVILCPVMITP